MHRGKGFLIALVGILLILTLQLIRPFLQYILGAVLIAFALYPFQVRLERYTSSMIAALTLVGLTIVGFVAPFLVVVVSLTGEARQILRNLDLESIRLEPLETLIEEYTGQEVDLASEIASSAETISGVAFEQSLQAFSSLMHFTIGVILGLFLVYYLLKEGDDLLDWVYRTVPFPQEVQRDLHRELGGMMWGVLFGHVFVAIVQGGVAGIGFFVTGIPNATFWTVVMMIFAMVPLVGAIPIWGGGVVFLFVSNEPLLAVGLFVYCVVVVGVTDDYLRPFAVDRYADLNPAVVLLGILGGAYAFGIMGLFYGPIIIGGLKATLQVLSENWDELEA